MSVSRRKRTNIAPIYLAPHDTLSVWDETAPARVKLAEETVDRFLTVDAIVTVDVKDEYGLVDGIGVLMGQRVTHDMPASPRRDPEEDHT